MAEFQITPEFFWLGLMILCLVIEAATVGLATICRRRIGGYGGKRIGSWDFRANPAVFYSIACSFDFYKAICLKIYQPA